MKQFFLYSLLLFSLLACRQNKAKEDAAANDGFTTDTNWQYKPPGPRGSEEVPMAFFDSTLFDHDNLSEVSKRQLLFLSIDSTYSAIGQIENIKNEMSVQSTAGYSAQERNLRAKALNQLNLLQNMLARQADEAVLANLKKHTEQLQAINAKTQTNVEHLQELSAKLVRAGMVLQNITRILSFCVGKAVIKPPTPATATPAQVKAGLP